MYGMVAFSDVCFHLSFCFLRRQTTPPTHHQVKGHHPFDPTSLADDEEIADSILHSEPDWDGVEPKAASLIRQMLSRNPQDRPSAREVLQNSWLQQLQ